MKPRRAPEPPSPDEVERILAGFRDHEDFCRQSLTIRNKVGQTVPLQLTPAQVALTEAVGRQQREGVPVRVVILKARQVHMSVGSCSHVFKRTAFLPGQQSMIFGDRHKSAKNLWGYCDQFERSYKSYHGIRKLQLKRHIQDQRLEWDGGSFVEVASAETVTSGRSYSIRHLLLSEYAYYRDAAKLMTGIMQSVPDDSDTTIIVESTANGIGGPFYDLWQRATDPNAKSGWATIFFAWWEHPEYVRALPMPGNRFQDSLTREEQDLQAAHNLTLAQLAWRRWAIAEKCEGNLDRFHQEYPSTPEEAFLTSGRPRFDAVSLARMPIVRDPLAGELERVRVGTQEQVHFMPHADGTGSLRIWKRPSKGRQYVIGGDSAEGIDVGDELGTSDPDYAVAEVFERETGDQVACLRERLTPATFGAYLYDLGWLYNWAFLVIEAGGAGLGTIEELLRLGYPIGQIYQRRRMADDRHTPSLQELGFRTTATTKPQLISTLDRALRESAIFIRDPITLQECRTFVYKPNGRQEGQQGCHDDCVIGVALAVLGIMVAPRQKPSSPYEERPVVRYGQQLRPPERGRLVRIGRG